MSTLILALLLFAVAAIWLPRSPLLSAATGIERWRAGFSEKTVMVAGRRITYLDSSDGNGDGAPILLVHPSGGDKDTWNRVARHLTPHHRVIAIDLPGFGDSERLAGYGDDLSDQVAALGAIAAVLGLVRFHIGGNSMGARIAAHYAAAHPASVLSLWLLGPGGVLSAEPSDLMRHLQDGGDNPLFIRRIGQYGDYLHWLMAVPPSIPAPVKQAMAQRALARADFHRQIFAAVAADHTPLENTVAGMTVPTRLVWGDRDRIWHVSGAQILLQHLPRASLLLLPGIGHLPMIEAPQRVAEDYLAFLKSL